MSYARMLELAYLRGYDGLVRRRGAAHRLDLLRASDRWPAARLREFQAAELRALVRHAVKDVPFYRDLVAREGIDVDAIRSPEDLHRLPLIDRETIRANGPRLLAERGQRGRTLWRATSGSTGEPLTLAYDRGSYDWRVAMRMRGYGWSGHREGEPTAFLWTSRSFPVRPALVRLKERAHDALLRRLYLDVWQLSRATVGPYAEAMSGFGARYLVAYSRHLYHFAREVSRQGPALPSLRAILLGVEPITVEEVSVIETVFGCPAFNTYGCREFMLIAAQCPARTGLHVSEENLVVEIVRDGRPAAPGEIGEVVVTDLHNYAMPFIRYRTGDLARFARQRCPCGRGHRMLEAIDGRVADAITTPDGRLVPGVFLPLVVEEFPAIARYQLVQREVDRVTLRFVREGDLDARELARLREALVGVLGDGMRVVLEEVAEIPLAPSGKHRIAVSELCPAIG